MDAFFFAPRAITVAAGKAVFFLDNVDATRDHRMDIRGASGAVLAASTLVRSDTKMVLTVQGLQPGNYVFNCSVVGYDGQTHAAVGMTGTLTVTP
jgi:plastocyanin